ncbi:MAG: tetratricopeptide repeat protein [Bacteroidales bacterium]|nr:tetratricopeptide repeat protein [Bacteroidales bacterium]
MPYNEAFIAIMDLPYDKYAGNLIVSEKLFTKALTMARKTEDSVKVGEVYARLAIINYLRGNYDQSVDYNQKAIELFLNHDKTVKAGYVYCEMGYQMKRRNMSLAFYYMRKGLYLLENADSIPNMSAPYDNYGVLLEMKNCYDSALIFYNKALAIKEKTVDSIGIPFSLNNIAQTYMLQKKYSSAKDYLDRAFTIRKIRNDIFGIIENYSLYGDYFLQQDKISEAIKFYQLGLEKAKVSGYLYVWQYISNKLSICYEKTGNYPLALKFHRENQQIRDSIINSETNDKIARLEVQFRTIEKEKELERKAKEVAILNQVKVQQELKLSNRNMVIFGISGLSVILILLFLLLFQRFRQKHQLKMNNALLMEKERGIKAVIEAEEEERNRIARELHDGVGQQMSGLKLAWQNFNNRFLKDEKEAITESERLFALLDNSSTELRSISHQMMPKALKEVGLQAAISDMLNASFRNTTSEIRLDIFGIETRYEKNIEIAIFRVCQELTSNIIKYANASNIDIQLYQSKGNLILSVEDDGAGFDMNKRKDGIGLTNIKSRVESAGGTFFIESEPSRGTRATIRIPV